MDAIERRAFVKGAGLGALAFTVGGAQVLLTPAEAFAQNVPLKTLKSEEAATLAAMGETLVPGARAGGILRLERDVAEGLQWEWLYAWDVELPRATAPQNRDGEVAGFALLPVREALALAAGDRMTVDAALVTIDFALRHALVDPAEASAIAGRVRSLRVERA